MDNNRQQIWADAESRRRLTRVALTILDSPALAEEIVQEAYLRLLVANEGTIESPFNWLVKVTRNLALDQARRRLRERELLLLVPGPDVYEQHPNQHAVESQLAGLVSCLLEVSDSQITALVLLHVVFGMSYEDIAAICGRSPAACRQAGRRALRKCFNDFDTEEPIDEANNADMYVQAILDASMAPLIDSLSVISPVSMLGVSPVDASKSSDSMPMMSGRTRQVLVLTTSGVRWALVLDGMVLSLFNGNASPMESDSTCLELPVM